VWVAVQRVEPAALPGWLHARAAALKVDLAPEAAQLICARVEGNLLAARQELEKLALLAQGERIGVDLVMRSVGDSARYDVFQLAAAAAGGDAERALRIVLGLKSEGVEPTLILWALSRELRGLWQARERGRLRSNTRTSPWNLAATPAAPALKRLRTMPLGRLLRQAHHTDRVIKGLAGGEAWTAIMGLTASMVGALQATADSGRVPG
jgi:DNA polymerase-3 subunit delta